MLANNNEAIINKLAKNSVKTNKKQYAILFFSKRTIASTP